MKPLLRTTKAECPIHRRHKVHFVRRVDTTFGDAKFSPSPDEVWACEDCKERFIKGPGHTPTPPLDKYYL
jgi:hypothetical protein